MMLYNFLEMDTDRKKHWYYHPWFVELLQLFYLDISGTDPSNFELYDEVISDYNAYLDEHPRPPKPILTGDEVMALLWEQAGPSIGAILKNLYSKQLAKEIQYKSEAIEFLKQEGIDNKI
jgi:hypothetical protein